MGTLVPTPLSSSSLLRPVGLKLEGVSGSTGGLAETPVAEPHPQSQSFQLRRSGVGPRICISSELTGDVNAAPLESA